MPQPAQHIPPTVIVIFGATGDLARKKLFPSLLDLYETDQLLTDFRIIAFTRRDWTDEDFRADIKKHSFNSGDHHHAPDRIDGFLQLITHFKGEFDTADDFDALVTAVNAQEAVIGKVCDRLFYLAVPPQFYTRIAEALAASGITDEQKQQGRSSILIEKPFGEDLQSAHELDMHLGRLFAEEQLFRIDHYLAKETIQNILMFRFSNAIFAPLWNARHIESVHLLLYEEKGLDGRVTFYDGVGALRDVGQNHLLQMLALVAMDDPGELSTHAVRLQRARILESLRLFPGSTPKRAQYKGYAAELGLETDSTTETYFKVTAELNTERWRGVPFILESGKGLHTSEVAIVIKFRPTQSSVCSLNNKADCVYQNKLIMRIQPNQGMDVYFWTKKPGFDTTLVEKKLSFDYYETDDWRSFPDAYQHVLYNAMIGEQLLYPSSQEQLAQWHFVSPILDAWQERVLHVYERGSDPGTIGGLNY